MDFKSLISKINSLDTQAEKKPVVEQKEVLRLDEDTEFRVLAGLTPLTESLIAEKKLSKAEKDKKEEVVKSMKKDKEGFEKRYGKKGEEVMHATATKIAKKKEESAENDDEALNEYESKDGKYVHKGKYGADYDGSDHQEEPKKKEKSGMTGAERREQKAKDKEQDKASKEYEKKHGKGSVTRHKMESAELDKDSFQKKFDSMVEAKKDKMSKKDKKMDEASKPDFLDLDKDGNKKEPMKSAAKDKGSDKKDSGKKGMSPAQEKYFGKKKSVKESVFEADQEGPADLLAAVEEEMNNPGGSVDNLRDVLNATFGADRSPEFKKARAVIGKYLDLVDNAEMGSEEDGIAPMRGGNVARHIKEYDLTDYLAHASSMLDKVVAGAMGESYKSKKKTVKESVEQKLSFRDMMKLVVESGGQQAIDPLDKALFDWATRVAQKKFSESTKAEVYAGLVYERMGGRFEMYDVLSEGYGTDADFDRDDYDRPGFKRGTGKAERDSDSSRQEKSMIASFKASGKKPSPGSPIYALMKKHNAL